MTHPPVPRFPNRAHGPVGVLDAESIDGREIDSAGFVIAALPIPLMAINRAGGPDHGGARLAGRIDAAGVDLNTGQVIVTEAITELPPGEYACGMDLSNVTFELRTADGTPLEDIGLIELDAEEDQL